MILVSEPHEAFCCICNLKKKDTMTVFLTDKYKQTNTELNLCKPHMGQLADTLNFALEEVEQE